MHVTCCEITPRTPDSTASVRRCLRTRLAGWDLEILADDANLIVSELLSNALRHGRPPVHVRVALLRAEEGGRTLHMEVADAGHRLDTDAIRAGWTYEGLWSEGGRGLLLVDALASRWGEGVTGQGHTVWAHLDAVDRDG
ncbi:ATP-binding protein [Streptomyces sp. NPDC021356]|uniref:ATP-binding protein n=1 Tax=Streptomyces sp. NPDC021356 TaxID=3154900 RepID=UPI0033C618E8